MITVIDYGMGNSGSILNMLARIGVEAELTSKLEDIARAERLILPGVGAFDTGMAQLAKLGLPEVLTQKVVREKVPILGICLGMQLFADGSQEGVSSGLGWIAGRVLRFPDGELRVPHMGWNRLLLARPHPLLQDMDEDARFYFVHSYHLVCDSEQAVLARCHYGVNFVAAVAQDSIFGVQFHPEKSLRWGMQLLRRFSSYAPQPTAARDSVPAAAEHRAG